MTTYDARDNSLTNEAQNTEQPDEIIKVSDDNSSKAGDQRDKDILDINLDKSPPVLKAQSVMLPIEEEKG